MSSNSQYSIREKLSYGLYFILFLVITGAVLTYAIVKEVENALLLVEKIDIFWNDTLEMRRFEKNWFLYAQPIDFRENMSYCDKLTELVQNNNNSLPGLFAGDQHVEIHSALVEYKTKMQALQKAIAKDDTAYAIKHLQDEIRQHGKTITDFAEKRYRDAGATVKVQLKIVRIFLICFATIVIVIVFFANQLISKKVIGYLAMLESFIQKISHGEVIEEAGSIPDAEINTLVVAFNRMRNELNLRQKHLVQAEKLASLGTLLSGVAHELCNPLSNISTSAQILAEEIEEADLEYKKELINQIEEQTDKSRDIIKTLLDFARIKEFKLQEILLAPLIEDTIKLLRGQIPSEVQISREVPPDITIYVERQRIQQVFLNLIKNALDAVGEQGKIWITARQLCDISKKTHEVEIFIEDNGPGIPAEMAGKIFDPFFTTKDVGKGSGLGLFIVHDIIEAHEGRITVESRKGAGTTFAIWLPDHAGRQQNT